MLILGERNICLQEWGNQPKFINAGSAVELFKRGLDDTSTSLNTLDNTNMSVLCVIGNSWIAMHTKIIS